MKIRKSILSLLIPAITALGSEVGDGKTVAPVPPTPEPSPYADRMTGDWFGARTSLADHGITIQPRFTQFYQGLARGVGDQSYEWGAKADVLVNVDVSKLGLWSGLSLTVHAEGNMGLHVNGRGRTLIPQNTALKFPGDDGRDAYDLTSVFLTQRFGPMSLSVGKINMIDMAAGRRYIGGAGIDSFQNIAFAAPITGLVPPYIFGGILALRTKPVIVSLAVFDPHTQANRTGLDDPFRDGVNVLAGVEFPIEIAGLKGTQGIKAAYSTQEGLDFNDIPELLLQSVGFPVTPGTKDERWYAGYYFDQQLYQSKADPRVGWGIFGQFALHDGNPTPFDWSMFAGLGGSGLVPGRPADRWGAGFFHYSIADDLGDVLRPLVTLECEQGVEVFYNCAVTPWLHVTVDAQWIRPGVGSAEDAVFLGVRNSIKF